jgi:hypothetical protein
MARMRHAIVHGYPMPVPWPEHKTPAYGDGFALGLMLASSSCMLPLEAEGCADALLAVAAELRRPDSMFRALGCHERS